MKAQFWQDKWKNNEIGFHQDASNPHLTAHCSGLNIPSGREVFVPLCGKSRDILWLLEQGYSVVGIELSPLAVEAFFAENGLSAQITTTGKLACYRTENITLYCGDFFDLSAKHLTKVHAVYDRGSLIALPPTVRKHYAQHLLSHLPQKASMLVITMEYAQHEMDGPPFSVTEEELNLLYSSHFSIEQCGQADILQEHQIFVDRGLSRLQEKSYLLTRL